MRIGVISDTHGLLRPEAVEALRGVDRILHAGDVGDDGILDTLRELAPLSAIRGNVDRSGASTERCAELPPVELVELGGFNFYMLHDLQDLDLDPVAGGVQVVVCGQSHHASIEWRRGVLYLNPGSAGPRRFSLPVTIAHVLIDGGVLSAQICTLLA
jgi:putative phosphoesterase